MVEKIVFIGAENEKNVQFVEALQKQYDVLELASITDETGEIVGIRDTLIQSEPKLIVVSLYGLCQDYEKTFDYTKVYYNATPIIILGKKSSHAKYEKYYGSPLFNPLNDPEASDVVDECNNKLGISELEGERKHILIVDDNALTLRNIKKMLEDKYSVSVAVSGAQAFIAIGKNKPDLILLDYDMPVMDGKMVLESLRADVELAKIPIIFLTSMAQGELVAELIQMKPAGYILKPPDKVLLRREIKAVFER